MSIDTSCIPAIIKSLKDEDNQINWAYFILKAEACILTSAPNFKTTSQLKTFWLKVAKEMAAEEGCVLNVGADLLHHRHQRIQHHQRAQHHRRVQYRRRPQHSHSTTSKQSTEKLAVLTDLDILSKYDRLEPSKAWKLSTGKIVEEQMHKCALSKSQEQ
ncbi:hypothetical protein MBANPS3_006285 [Mucor bainieri]